MTIIRAEKLPGESQNGFVKADLYGYFHSSNCFGTLLDNDFVEIDLTNPAQPVFRQRMTWGAAGNPGQNADGTDNLSVARAFPFRVLGTAFGKIFDVYGYNQSPRLVDADPALGDRGYVWETAAAVDLNAVTTLQGFPAPINDFPNADVRVSANIANTLYNNVLVDMYAHYDTDPPDGYILTDPLNDNIQPPYSKHLNVQMQLDHGILKSTTAHAWGYSGATVLGNAVIDGQLWRYGHKQETLNNNNFPFISFCGWDGTNYVPVTQFNAKNVWDWVVDNWATILTQADAAGVSYAGVTQATLRASYCDGIHAGSEVLGPGTGNITFSEMEIEILPDNTNPTNPTGPTTPDEISDAQYTAWLNDPANDCYRLFLAEVDHSGGQLNFANRGWLSDGNVPYHEWLDRTPVFREGLTGVSAGTMDIVNPRTATDNWNQYSIHGHQVRWYVGDERWRKSEFRQILTTQSEGAPRYQSQGAYQFGLVSQTDKYRINFINTSMEYDDTALAVVADVLSRANNFDSEIRTYQTVGNVNMLTELRFDVDENSILDDVLISIATSVNAWRRIGQDGVLEFVSKDREITSTYTFNQSSIDGQTIRQIASIDPVAIIRVPFFNDAEEVSTTAEINGLSTTVTIDSVIKNQADALALGKIEAQRYARPRNRYVFDLLDRAEELNIADQVLIDHGEIGGKAYISNMERRVLENVTALEVTI